MSVDGGARDRGAGVLPSPALLSLLLALAVALGGCGESPVGAAQSAGSGSVQLVSLTPAASVLLLGDTSRFSTTVLDASGAPLQRTVTWTSSAPAVVTVNGAGLVRAVGPGEAMIMASADDVATLADVSVPPPTGVATSAGADIRAVPEALSSVELSVPPGAVADSTPITIEPLSKRYVDSVAPDPRLVAGTAYRLAPDGLRFATPATLSISYDPVRLTSATPDSLLRLHELVGGQWQLVPGSHVDTTSSTVSGPIDGFTAYGIVAVQNPPPSP